MSTASLDKGNTAMQPGPMSATNAEMLYADMLEQSNALDSFLESAETSLQAMNPDIAWLPLGLIAIVQSKLLEIAEAEALFFDFVRPYLEQVNREPPSN